MEPTFAVVAVVVFLAAAAGSAASVFFLTKGRSGPGPHGGGLPAARDEDFTFKGHFVVYETGKKNKPYKKRPKKWIKVFYKNPKGAQFGTVTFANWTDKKVKIEFPSASPFAATDFLLDPGDDTGEQQVDKDPGDGNEVDYSFIVKIEQDDGSYAEFDPGVRVRRG